MSEEPASKKINKQTNKVIFSLKGEKSLFPRPPQNEIHMISAWSPVLRAYVIHDENMLSLELLSWGPEETSQLYMLPVRTEGLSEFSCQDTHWAVLILPYLRLPGS